MKFRFRFLAILLVVAGLWGSCLEFDAQDIVARYDQEKDQLNLLLVYRGFHIETRNGNDSGQAKAKAIEDLREAMNHGKMAFWENWPLALDPVTMVDPPGSTLVDRHLDVENGGLFTDMEGQLCGYQFVRIRKVKALLKAVNPLIGLALQTEMAASRKREKSRDALSARSHINRTLRNLIGDEETADLLIDAVRGGHQFLSISEAGLRFAMPCSVAFHRQARGDIQRRVAAEAANDLRRATRGHPSIQTEGGIDSVMDDLKTAVPDPLEMFTTFGFLAMSDLELFREDEETSVFRWGFPGCEAMELHKPPSHEYKPELLAALRELEEFKIEENVPDQELARRFDAFQTRDAKMPKAIIEKRQ